MSKGQDAGTQEHANGASVPTAMGAVFAHQLEWRLKLAYLDGDIVIQLEHISHVQSSTVLEQGVQPLARCPPQLLPEPIAALTFLIPRSWFTDEEQIKAWFRFICDAIDANLHGMLAFEIGHHISDLLRFTLDLMGIRACDKNKLINDHINGTPDNIGTREFLRILLGARGSNNKSPANEYNLPMLIRHALRNLRPSRLLTHKGVNDYMKLHFPAYAQSDGDSLRKLCSNRGIDFVALVAEERARRAAKPEN